MPASNWNAISESQFPWEREALQFVRERFPAHEPYRAWSNFEFLADDGTINEVDLLLFTPQGLFLVEIKSRPGRLTGDQRTWTWYDQGRVATSENPLFLANAKAKRLRSLLQRQKALRGKGQAPFIEALVFCSAENLQCELSAADRQRICLRDRDSDAAVRNGIMAAVLRRQCSGLDLTPKGEHDRPMARLVSQALEQAGVRGSQRHRRVSDYELQQVIDEGPGFQDWRAVHAQMPDAQRRIRIYSVPPGASAEEAETIERAARREFQILEGLRGHRGVLQALQFTRCDLGLALILEHDPLAVRLDHYLQVKRGQLSVDAQLQLLRQIAEVVQFAHDKKVVHRTLSPKSVLVTEAGGKFQVKLFNWQSGFREAGSVGGVTATSHVDRLVDDASAAYLAPEALHDADLLGEHVDVFSLGAIAYLLFSGQEPAASGAELNEKLLNSPGLQLSAVMNGPLPALQELVQYSTHPQVDCRVDTASDFLALLDNVESELTQPDEQLVTNPNDAKQGDLLPGGFTVRRRLGTGACSIALLVEREGQDYVLKVASAPEHNRRLQEEAEVLAKLHHAHIVLLKPEGSRNTLEIGDRTGFLLEPVFSDKDKGAVETLGHRLRQEGRLHVDLLQRFGDDLLGVVNYLEEQGVAHRDIKPDNIAVGMVKRGDKLHLVLFDFSLSRSPVDNLTAGTSAYLDPLLPERKRWDLHAERYAAALTLHELATGALPRWGDGQTAPLHVAGEITINPEQFDPGLRQTLPEFFRKAFRRNVAERFDNAEEMLREWRRCFENLDVDAPSEGADDEQLAELLADADRGTLIAELPLSTRATSALDRAGILTVEDLLEASLRRLHRLRGVGNKTRREIVSAVRLLRDRLGKPEPRGDSDDDAASTDNAADVTSLSVDLLAARVTKFAVKDNEFHRRAIRTLLGLETDQAQFWPSQTDVAGSLEASAPRIHSALGKQLVRWSKDRALQQLRSDLVETLGARGGVLTTGQLASAVLTARGSVAEEPRRTQLAGAVVRAAVETERSESEARLHVQRERGVVVVALNPALADYAVRLGRAADKLADEDTIVTSAEALTRLRALRAPEGLELPDARLLQLAASASQSAALSSRQELYPRGLDALRALRLSQGALLGAGELTAAQLRERVASRYAEAQPLPDRPLLDQLLEQAGVDLQWVAAACRGLGGYRSSRAATVSVSSATSSLQRFRTTPGAQPAGHVSPEEAAARLFEERLQRSLQQGTFLTLLVGPRSYERAIEELRGRFKLDLIDFEGLFLEALQQCAAQANVDWQLVVAADAAPGAGDWSKLQMLVARALQAIEPRLHAASRPMLITYAGLLGRYDQLPFIERLTAAIARPDGPPGAWLVIPNPERPELDGGRLVPLFGAAQCVRIPDEWLMNVHRGGSPPSSAIRKSVLPLATDH